MVLLSILAVHRLLHLQCFPFKQKPLLRKLGCGAGRGQPLPLMQTSSCTLMTWNQVRNTRPRARGVPEICWARDPCRLRFRQCSLFLVCQHFIKSSSSSNKPTKTLWQIYEDLTLLMLNCLINDKLSFICKFGHSVLSRQKRLLHIRFFKYWEGKWNRKMHRHGRAFSQVSGAVARRVMFTALRKTGL